MNTEELALFYHNLCCLKGALEQCQVHIRRLIAQLAVNLAEGTATQTCMTAAEINQEKSRARAVLQIRRGNLGDVCVG